ncbi:MAG: DMT family transporter [Pararhizobium sp.]
MTAILLKVCSVTVFVGMSTCIKAAGDGVPAGQIVFFRSAFAIIPILVWLAAHGQLKGAFATERPLSHVLRGLVGVMSMGFSFYGLTKLPLPEAIAIGYASPLIAVVFAAIFLRETVRLYRWSAVVVGLLGVLVICWPKLTLFGTTGVGAGEAFGVVALIVSSVFAAMAMIVVRRLIKTEKTPTIVLYFSLSSSLLALLTMPFGWAALDLDTAGLLILAGLFGGVGQMLLTHSYRFGDVSTIAPFEYTSILLGLVIGYVLFGEIPTATMLVGTVIVVSAGIFIIFRERSIGIRRKGARRVMTPQG